MTIVLKYNEFILVKILLYKRMYIKSYYSVRVLVKFYDID